MKNEEIRNVLVEQGKKRKDTMAVVVSIIPGGGKEDSNYKFALLRHSEGKDLVTISRGKKTLFDGTFEDYEKYLESNNDSENLLVRGQSFSNMDKEDQRLSKALNDRYMNIIRVHDAKNIIGGKMVNEGRELKRGRESKSGRGFGKK